MAIGDIRMRVRQVGLEQSMEEGYNQGARRIQRRPLKIGMDSRAFEQPLGRITGQLGEFQKIDGCLGGSSISIRGSRRSHK